MKKSDLLLQENMKNEPLYLRVYNYYKELISSGKLTAGAKLPSIRRCAQELEVSRTTVEAAYFAVGSRGICCGQATKAAFMPPAWSILAEAGGRGFSHGSIRPRLISGMILRPLPWMRKALISRCGDGISKAPYGQTGGYSPMASRRASPISAQRFCSYVAKSRNVVCTPEQIVVGAGVQSLLHILCGLLDERPPVGFWNNAFAQGRAIF